LALIRIKQAVIYMATRFPLVVCSIGSLLVLAACGGGGGSATNNNAGSGASSSNSSVVAGSHNAGLDCLTCHRTGGSGAAKGIFTVAGTITKPSGGAQIGATVKLYVHNTNTVVKSLVTDGSGNFYTTDAISAFIPRTGQQFADGADIEVTAGGTIRTMPGVITSGGCNGCHGAPGAGNPGAVVATYVDTID
jgi:hypothetical protein